MVQELFERATQPEGSELSVPKAALVFAHPDDETIALGARLGRFGSALIVHVTDGAPRDGRDSLAHNFKDPQAYRKERERELSRALKAAGIERAKRISLQIPDQEASLHLPQLAQNLQMLLSEHRSEVVFTHPYEGGHPDHDACAFAVHKAAAWMEADGHKPPMIIEAAFYHAGTMGIEVGCFLPDAEKTRELSYLLSPKERQKKQALFACFSSQEEMLRYFTTEEESFRIAPRYDFHEPPHRTVFYEWYPWGMTSRRFCELTRAADALEEMRAVCR